MRKIGAVIAIAALGVVMFSSPPAEAFSLRIGPFHIGFPFYFRHFHRHLYMHANPNDLARREQQPQQPDTASALLYPNEALSTVFQNIFWPSSAAAWPFGYQDIFSTAFAKMPADTDQRQCQPALDANQMVGRIRQQVSPTADQMQLLQRLGGALGVASGYLAKACPDEIPAQPVARLQLMESQIEELAMAIDIVRQPLAAFEQSLNANQQAKFAAVSADQSTGNMAACGSAPAAIDSSIDQIDKVVQTTDTQRGDLGTLKQAFGKAASDLDAHCPTSVPKSPLARLETIEARLDATWRSELAIQVAMANFQSKLTAEQKDRFDQMNFAGQ
jgi:hypothetical protein